MRKLQAFKYILASAMLLGTLPLGAQTIWQGDNGAAVHLSPDRIYNYNRYEGSRWGLGAEAMLPVGKKDLAAGLRPKLYLAAYGGYGLADHAMKYGATAGLMMPRRHRTSVFLDYADDLDQQGGHKLSGYSLLNTSDNASYLAQLFSASRRIGLNATTHPTDKLMVSVGAQHSTERYLFTTNGALCYPRLYPTQTMPLTQYNELYAQAVWNQVWTLFVTGGVYESDFAQGSYVRGIVQYDRTMKKERYALNLYGQGGWCNARAPYSRMFDISGTAYSYYFFRHTFLTVMPYTFTANAYLHLCLNYTTTQPLWRSELSNPKAFAQVQGMWGTLTCGDDPIYAHTLISEGVKPVANGEALPSEPYMLMAAPTKGLAEVSAGITHLLRVWGFDFGVALAYQLTPASAWYHHEDRYSNLAFLSVATLQL